jgi:hypothetical protein
MTKFAGEDLTQRASYAGETMTRTDPDPERDGGRVNTPFWTVALPDDPSTAVYIVICLCLFGSLCVVVRASQSPSVSLVLGGGILLLFFAVIVSYDRCNARSRAPLARKRRRPFRLNSRPARIPADRG